jgi:hypothetical protein
VELIKPACSAIAVGAAVKTDLGGKFFGFNGAAWFGVDA